MKAYIREFFSHQVIQLLVILGAFGIVLTVKNFQGYRSLLFLGIGALIYAVAEYVVHRFLFHEYPNIFPSLYKKHMDHHREPNHIRYLFSPVHYDMIIYAVYVALLWGLFRDLTFVAPIVTGTIFFQFYYQWMHYAAHRPVVPRTPWGRWMKKKHLQHHFQDEHTWYGVSHPVLDYVMHTDEPKSKSKNHQSK